MKICEICGKTFKSKSPGDIYCGILCLNASITNEEQELWITKKDDRGITNCPICGRHKKYLIHKRMNGQWFLWQEYHYNHNKSSINACYYCNLWEMNYRKRTGKHITPEKHKEIINNEIVET